jgi:cytochrome c peroxidase
MKRSRRVTPYLLALIAALSVGAYMFMRSGNFWSDKRVLPRGNLSDEELRGVIKGMRLRHPKPQQTNPSSDAERKALVALGAKLFFDPGFSSNSRVSCATCHQPDKSFTDGLGTAEGLTKTSMNTPTLINAYAGHWFFWNGRADSLEAQAMGPVENPKEHGFSRVQVAHRVSSIYRSDYEKIFGRLPLTLPAASTPPPAIRPPVVSEQVAAYALATLGQPQFLKKILRTAQSQSEQPVETLRRMSAGTDESDTAFDKLEDSVKNEVNQVFVNFTRAIAAFERTIKSGDTPFDLFADRLEQQATLAAALGGGFGEKELRGLRLFTGRGGCTLCHAGPRFTDEQFHNIGLSATSAESVDLGRAQGMLLAKADIFNCHGSYLKQEVASESCLELQYLETESAEAVGAFKTPTLRNLKFTAPYGHDGRFATLMDILQHYNHLGVKPAVGHIEDSLLPLELTNDELHDLESFMMSLNSHDVTFDRGEP